MASMSFRTLHLRTISSFNFMITHLLGCRFCSGDSKNGERSQVFAQKETVSVIPEGKDLELVVSCLRVDRVIASGLGIGRRKASDLIAARKLYVNKENCKKPSLEVKEGDEIDLEKSKESSEVELSRFKVLAIDKNQTKKNKRRLNGIRFSRILIPRKEFDEKYTHPDS